MEIKFLSFDIDRTLYESESDDDCFYKRWTTTKFSKKPLLCYNTGRLLDDVKDLINKKILPKPDYLISGVGTNIYDWNDKKIIKEFSQVLDEGWNDDLISLVISQLPYKITKQPDQFQNEYKSSWFFENANPEDIHKIKKYIKDVGLEANVVYSSSLHLDILPKWANKGNALEWLLKHLNIKPEDTIVGGDSGNDSAMFRIPGINGIVVGNAQPELYHETKDLSVFFSEKFGCDAIFEGLSYFGLEFEEFEIPKTVESEQTINLSQLNLMDDQDIKGITKKQIDFIKEGYKKAIEVVKRNITPLGFSACSLSDNISNGVDENYRSVWARDGSIAITGLHHLIKDEEINKGMRDTLTTLIKNISLNGQVPSNVRIESDQPDYSGVGGICSIDSGLWLIIAFHDYIRASKDINFLREHFPSLLRIMEWLSAQDGNNDALLEIPEAGDWTDLFGRSYNILYDEVLWFRANICFGRMLELLGNDEIAGDYLRWSQLIKREILLNFWPTTKNKLYHSMTFAEQQYSLGDSRYLIAQVTPFDFSWRCDVYGNVLAFLYDVIDIEKATLAFRFMWGAGINHPYPVENVYPAVHAGDPDWRPYYTVNLLNLPHHYHNGGIWPFIGGGWVRFVNKIGLREIAMKELFKLAKLNKLGILNEWEFNEWHHGKTGRPMGKAFQIWSASEYIHACHDLKIIK